MKFIRLSTMLINPSAIRSIILGNARFTLRFTSERTEGLLLFGSGMIESKGLELVFDKKEHPSDYDVIQSWIRGNER